MYFRQFFFISAVLSTLTACSRNNHPHSMEIVEETYVHKYGVSVPSEDWKERGEEGQVIATLKNGVVVTKNYVKGRLEGECTYTFPYNKQVQRVEIYRSNVLVSEGAFYPSGAPMQEIHFAPNGAKTRLMWYENGSPMSREEYDAEAQIAKGDYYDVHHNQDSKVMDYEGTRTLRDRYGILISQDAINNGRMAERITFHSNGTPKEIIPYEEETVNGNYKRFYPDGEPQAIEEWQDGRQHGLTILFENGEKIAEVTYANGMKTGLERRFREGSEITQEIYWLNNQRHGQCTTYLGRAPQVEWYYKGEPVTRGNFEVLSEALP